MFKLKKTISLKFSITKHFMHAIKFSDQLISQLSLKKGIKIIHYAILIVIIALIFLLFSNEKQQEEALTFNKPTMITPVVLKAIYEQNINEKLAYVESKPILLSMEKYLYQFETLLPTNPAKAMGALLVVKSRLLYLKNKGLDVSRAEKILEDFLNKQKDNKPD